MDRYKNIKTKQDERTKNIIMWKNVKNELD